MLHRSLPYEARAEVKAVGVVKIVEEGEIVVGAVEITPTPTPTPPTITNKIKMSPMPNHTSEVQSTLTCHPMPAGPVLNIGNEAAKLHIVATRLSVNG